MFKNISRAFASLIITFYALQGFAISLGAGQAQIRNNMQEMQQNKQRMQQMKRNPQLNQQQKPVQTPRKQQRQQNQAE